MGRGTNRTRKRNWFVRIWNVRRRRGSWKVAQTPSLMGIPCGLLRRDEGTGKGNVLKNGVLILCSSTMPPEHGLMRLIDSLYFFILGQRYGVASCSSSRDHLEPTVCPADSRLPLPNQPVNHQTFVHTFCAPQASTAEPYAGRAWDSPGKPMGHWASSILNSGSQKLFCGTKIEFGGFQRDAESF